MLDKLIVSKSGYYDYVNRKPSKQKVRKQELSKKIKAIHEESHEIYGAPKITVKLNQSGIKVSEKYVGNIMREMGIKAHYIRPCTITTKDSDFSSKLKNILNRNFNPEKRIQPVQLNLFGLLVFVHSRILHLRPFLDSTRLLYPNCSYLRI